MDSILLKNSIRLLVGGYLFDGNDIDKVPDLLRWLAVEYEREIDKQA